ncbi:hypothetical protein U1Q18_034102 [Sarracenia purpurea var. burkii]
MAATLIRCRKCTPEQQEAMIKRWPPAEVYALESDHSPFFSSPFLLFRLLVKVAASDVVRVREFGDPVLPLISNSAFVND